MKRYWDYIVGRRQTHVAVAAVVALALCGVVREVHAATRLLPQEELRQLGLVRAWFAQVRLDRSRNHLERAVLDDDQLTVLTNAGVVQQLNALTGETLWVAPIGNENYPSLGPACSDKYVALVNGSTLYVLDRVDGRPVIIRRIGGAPGACAGDLLEPRVCAAIERADRRLSADERETTDALVLSVVRPDDGGPTCHAGKHRVGHGNRLPVRGEQC